MSNTYLLKVRTNTKENAVDQMLCSVIWEVWEADMSPVLPQNNTQELLTLCLLVFQGHNEVPHTATCAVVIDVLLQ